MGIYKFNSPDYACLAIDYPVEIELNGIVYPNALKAFAASRFSDDYMRSRCLDYDRETLNYVVNNILDGPLVLEGFYHNMYSIFYDILMLKFSKQDLRDKLLSTHEERIIYISKNEPILGTYKGKGANMLGSTLMRIRAELTDKQLKRNYS